MHNEEFHYLYSSTSVMRIISSKIMRFSGHVWRQEEYIEEFSGNTKKIDC
jgi:hypothetical protein